MQAGSLWDQRLQQYLLANGVAVLVVNPAEQDSWDVGPSSWKVRGFQKCCVLPARQCGQRVEQFAARKLDARVYSAVQLNRHS